MRASSLPTSRFTSRRKSLQGNAHIPCRPLSEFNALLSFPNLPKEIVVDSLRARRRRAKRRRPSLAGSSRPAHLKLILGIALGTALFTSVLLLTLHYNQEAAQASVLTSKN